MRARHRHFNPKAAGATLVLDSRYITGLSDGNSITTWDDKSGNGYSPTQATAANKPTYKTGIQGGNAVARFDGNDSLYYNANLSTANALSLVAVAKYDSTSVRSALFDAKNYAASGNASFVVETNTFQSTGDNYDFYTSNASFEGNIAVTTNFTVISVAANTTSGGSVTANTTYRVNGTTNTLTARNSLNFTNLTGANGFMVGAFNNGGTPAFVFFDGDAGSISALPSQVTGALMKRLEHAAAYSFKISCN
jgi:hypothetical protein